LNLRSQAASGVKWNAVSMAVVTALQYITLAVLARLLNPSDFGLMGMVMVVIGFAQLFADMGISNAIIYRQDSTRGQLSSLYWINILAGLGVFLIVCGASPLIIAFYHEPRLRNLILLSSISFLIVPFGQQFQILLQKELIFNHLAKIEIISSFTNSILAIALALLGLGVFSLIWGQLAGTAISVFLLVRWGRNNWRPSFHFSKEDLKGYIGFGLYQMGEKAVNYFNTNLDYLLIGSMLGAKALGYYTLAYNLVLRPSQKINPVITRVAFPVFSKVRNDIKRLKSGYLKMLRLVSTTNFPIMAGLAVVAPVAVPIIFGNKWLPSIILIQILTIVGLLRSAGNPVGSILLSRGRADLSFKWNLALMVTQIPGLYAGARLGGTTGVATAFSILMCIYSIFIYPILIRRELGPCLKEYVASMWPALWMSGVMALAVLLSGFFAQNLPLLILLIVQILCGIGVYSVLIIFNQKELITEVKSMIWNRKLFVAKE
jgi:lipopolysaccharide exporter